MATIMESLNFQHPRSQADRSLADRSTAVGPKIAGHIDRSRVVEQAAIAFRPKRVPGLNFRQRGTVKQVLRYQTFRVIRRVRIIDINISVSSYALYSL
ncbi:MAG: hypothetical protein R3C97_06280 [Geminicoccaceae bacterium]